MNCLSSQTVQSDEFLYTGFCCNLFFVFFFSYDFAQIIQISSIYIQVIMYFYVLGHCWFKSISFADDSKEFFCLKILVLFVLKALKLSSYFDLPTTNDEVIRSSDIYRQTFNIVAPLCHLQNTYFLLVN